MKIYHNNRCSKSRCALDIINQKGKEVTIIEYLKTPLDKNDLTDLLKKLNIKAEDLIRKGEPEFKENFKGHSLNEEEWIEAMIKFPKLIERPIIVNGEKAVIGRPPEKVLEII
jgi:arsenate reductase